MFNSDVSDFGIPHSHSHIPIYHPIPDTQIDRRVHGAPPYETHVMDSVILSLEVRTRFHRHDYAMHSLSRVRDRTPCVKSSEKPVWDFGHFFGRKGKLHLFVPVSDNVL